MYANKQTMIVHQNEHKIPCNSNGEQVLQKLEDCEDALRQLNIKCKKIYDKIQQDFSLNTEFEDYRRYLRETDYRHLTWGKNEPEYFKPPKRHIHIFNSENDVYDLKIYSHDGDYQIYEWHTGTDYATQLFLAEDRKEKEQLAIAIIETWKNDPLSSAFMRIKPPLASEAFKSVLSELEDCSNTYNAIKKDLSLSGIAENELNEIERAALQQNSRYLPGHQKLLDSVAIEGDKKIANIKAYYENTKKSIYIPIYKTSAWFCLVGIGVFGLLITGAIQLIDKISKEIRAASIKKDIKCDRGRHKKKFQEIINGTHPEYQKERIKYQFFQTRKTLKKEETQTLTDRLREAGYYTSASDTISGGSSNSENFNK